LGIGASHRAGYRSLCAWRQRRDDRLGHARGHQYLINPGTRDLIDTGVHKAIMAPCADCRCQSLARQRRLRSVAARREKRNRKVPLCVSLGVFRSQSSRSSNRCGQLSFPMRQQMVNNAMHSPNMVALNPPDAVNLDVKPAIENSGVRRVLRHRMGFWPDWRAFCGSTMVTLASFCRLL